MNKEELLKMYEKGWKDALDYYFERNDMESFEMNKEQIKKEIETKYQNWIEGYDLRGGT